MELGEITLALPGAHNVVNALAACGVCIELDIPFDTIREALQKLLRHTPAAESQVG